MTDKNSNTKECKPKNVSWTETFRFKNRQGVIVEKHML